MKTRRGFSLVELPVVIAIISVLAAMLLPTLGQAMEHSRRIVCANHQRQIIMATAIYASEFNDRICWQPSSTGAHNNLRFWPSPTYRDAEFSYLVMVHLGIPLDLTWTGYRLATPKHLRHVIYCPTMRRPCDNPQFSYLSKYSRFSYGMYGLTFSRNDEPELVATSAIRYSKLAIPLGGKAKILLGDIEQPGEQYQGSTLPYYWMNHDFKGGNFGYADGSVKWSDMADMAKAAIPGHSYSGNCYFPKGKVIFGMLRHYGGGPLVVDIRLWNEATRVYDLKVESKWVREFY